MATFKACIFEHQRRADGKYPVSIRVTWRQDSAFIHTAIYVTDSQVSRKVTYNKDGKKKISLTIKDPDVIKEMNSRIAIYEGIKTNKLGLKIDQYSVKELTDYLTREGSSSSDSSIDFIEFSRKHCLKLEQKGRKTTADRMRQTVNAIIDFYDGRDKISIIEINSKFLNKFDEFLRGTRTMTRKNQHGKLVTIKRSGLSDVSVNGYIGDIRTLFNAAIDEYNDEDRDDIRIKHYPFRKYKFAKVAEPAKRVLALEQIRAIRDIPDEQLGNSRAILARDVFMLSFFLAGMNTADIYDVDKSAFMNGRLSYQRQKTRGRRQDRAFISLQVPPEALPYFEKYQDKKVEKVFCFAQMYRDCRTFNAAVDKGLKIVAERCKIKEKLSSYYARFSFATIAYNECGVSKDDVDLALDHVDLSRKMADRYIKKDWSLVDNAVRKVIDLLNGN